MRKALGEDGPGREVFHMAPGQIANKAWRPLAVRAACSLRPPLHFRGGPVVELLKFSSLPQLCPSYRYIILADTGGKLVVMATRPHFREAAPAGSQEDGMGSRLQCGATDAAHLPLRLSSFSSPQAFAALFSLST